MNNTLFCGFVDGRLSLSHQLALIFHILTCLFGSSHLFFQAPQGGFYRSVSKPSYLTLFRTFLCRFMVRQLGLAPCVSVLK